MSDEKETRLDKAREADPTRRDLLGRIGAGAFAVSTAACVAGLLRSVVPRVLPDPAEQFKIGLPEEYPQGTIRNFEDERVMVFRDGDGIYAISTMCTHLGCVVSYDEVRGFECPCHGSKFHRDGKVKQGPAPTPLPWVAIAKLPSGQLGVDKTKTVPIHTKMTI